MRTELVDAIVIFTIALIVLAVQDAFSQVPYKTAEEKAQWREARYARERLYEACVRSCSEGCAKESK